MISRKFSTIACMALAVLGMTTLSAHAAITIDGDVNPSSTGSWPTSDIYIGLNWVGSSGSVTVDDGSAVSTSRSVHLGFYKGSSGTLSIGVGSSLTSDILTLGYYDEASSGILYIEGTVTTNYSAVGFYGYAGNASSGHVTVNGPTASWTVRDQLELGHIGNNANVSLTVTNGGTVNVGTLFASLRDLHGDGTINVKGMHMDLDGATPVFSTDNSMTVSFGSGGTLRFDGTGELSLGYREGSTSVLTLDNNYSLTSDYTTLGAIRGTTATVTVCDTATWTTGNLNVGHDGNGTLNIADHGTVVSNGDVVIGRVSIGEVTVNGPGASWSTYYLMVCNDAGNGTLSISNGGTVTTNGMAYIGAYGYGTGTGTVTVGTDAKWNVTGDLFIGYWCHGILNITAGGTVNSTIVRLGNDSSGTGVVTVSGEGALWTIAGDNAVSSLTGLQLGVSGTGTLTIQNGGTVELTGASLANGTVTLGVFNNGRGTLNLLDGGTLAAQRITKGNGTATLNLNGGTIKALANQNDFFTSLGSLAIGANGFTFDTNGFDVTATNNFSGTGGITKDGAGTLTMSGVNTFTGDIAVRQGTLNFSNGFTFGDSDIAFTLNNDSICGKIAGTLIFAEAATVYLDFAAGFDFSLDEYAYQLFTGNLTGADQLTFASSDANWTVNVLSFDGGLLIFEFSNVPEPSTCLLLLGGVGALALRRRRVA